jgi:membrane protein implicated in regulation of membrane protease activity
MLNILGQIIRWFFIWLCFAFIICLAGAFIGVVTHLLFGLIFLDTPDYECQAALGFSNGLRYSGVWAGGLSIVLCVIRARKEYLQGQVKS